MIKLYGFGKGFGLIDASPFVLKVHTWLRMAKLEYETINRFSNIQKSPKGKLPYIDDNGERIGDSSAIIEHLEAAYAIDLDSWLTAEQLSTSYLLAKAIEEHWYWCLIYSRWIDDHCWPRVEKEFFSRVSFPMRRVVPFVVRRGTIIGAHKQGISRHSREEVVLMTKKTASHLSQFLADKPFFLGNQISNLDATAFGFLAQFVLTRFDSDYNDAVRSFPNLLQYCQKMQSSFFN